MVISRFYVYSASASVGGCISKSKREHLHVFACKLPGSFFSAGRRGDVSAVMHGAGGWRVRGGVGWGCKKGMMPGAGVSGPAS